MTLSFCDAVRSLGPGASLALDALNAAAGLRATSPTSGETEEGLAAYDGFADDLIVSTSALLVFAAVGAGRPGAAALRIAADGVDSHQSGRSAALSTVLNRVTLGITTIALSHGDPGALTSLAGIEVAGEPLLASNMLRYGRLHDGDAQATYEAAVRWLVARPWRSEITALARDDGLRQPSPRPTCCSPVLPSATAMTLTAAGYQPTPREHPGGSLHGFAIRTKHRRSPHCSM